MSFKWSLVGSWPEVAAWFIWKDITTHHGTTSYRLDHIWHPILEQISFCLVCRCSQYLLMFFFISNSVFFPCGHHFQLLTVLSLHNMREVIDNKTQQEAGIVQPQRRQFLMNCKGLISWGWVDINQEGRMWVGRGVGHPGLCTSQLEHIVVRANIND